MKKLALLAALLPIATAAFPQASSATGSGAVQFSGTLSMNLINNFLTSTADLDGVNGLSYLQLNPSVRDGPFGFDSELAVGPGNSVDLRYAYGYADFWNGRIHVSIGKFVDPDTFALKSFFVGGSDGAGSFGNPSLMNAKGSTGDGVDGGQLKLSPIKNLVFGFVLPYNNSGPTDTVDTSLKKASIDASFTLEKLMQLVAGYALGQTGVADLATQISNVDQNKLYALVNVLVSESLVAGARYELDHDVATWRVISNNAYLTLGGTLGDFSIGGDVGLYFPPGGSAGYEILGTTSYTLKSIFPTVDLEPVLLVSYVSSDYQESSHTSINFNPQLRLLLGKSQHQLAAGYSITYDLDSHQVALSQLNILMQVFF
jgi:hypothetical protein